VMEDASYAAETSMLQPGDLLIAFTDGVTEAVNAAGELYGAERLHSVIGAPGDPSAGGTIQRILESVDAFAGATPQADDIANVAIGVAAEPRA